MESHIENYIKYEEIEIENLSLTIKDKINENQSKKTENQKLQLRQIKNNERYHYWKIRNKMKKEQSMIVSKKMSVIISIVLCAFFQQLNCQNINYYQNIRVTAYFVFNHRP